MCIHNYKKDGVQRCYRIHEHIHPKSNVQLVLKCLDGNQLLMGRWCFRAGSIDSVMSAARVEPQLQLFRALPRCEDLQSHRVHQGPRFHRVSKHRWGQW